jgi:extradiol dioxygenase family protein
MGIGSVLSVEKWCSIRSPIGIRDAQVELHCKPKFRFARQTAR